MSSGHQAFQNEGIVGRSSKMAWGEHCVCVCVCVCAGIHIHVGRSYKSIENNSENSL
jgi:hypothetical protein